MKRCHQSGECPLFGISQSRREKCIFSLEQWVSVTALSPDSWQLVTRPRNRSWTLHEEPEKAINILQGWKHGLFCCLNYERKLKLRKRGPKTKTSYYANLVFPTGLTSIYTRSLLTVGCHVSAGTSNLQWLNRLSNKHGVNFSYISIQLI